MFISFEGPDGSGKTVQVEPTVKFLESRGHTVHPAREPGGTIIGDQVRQVLMKLENTSMLPRTETLLFCAARAQLVDEVIRPHLENGVIVLLDRYAEPLGRLFKSVARYSIRKNGYLLVCERRERLPISSVFVSVLGIFARG